MGLPSQNLQPNRMLLGVQPHWHDKHEQVFVRLLVCWCYDCSANGRAQFEFSFLAVEV
jgi:hypothetical protein